MKLISNIHLWRRWKKRGLLMQVFNIIVSTYHALLLKNSIKSRVECCSHMRDRDIRSFFFSVVLSWNCLHNYFNAQSCFCSLYIFCVLGCLYLQSKNVFTAFSVRNYFPSSKPYDTDATLLIALSSIAIFMWNLLSGTIP